MKPVLLLLTLLISIQSIAQTSADVAFQISTTTTVSPPSIKLTWRKVMNVTTYHVSRKLRTDVSWTVLVNNLTVNDTTYTDNTLLVGKGYEYRVSDPSMITTGYIAAAINLPATHNMGKLLLLVDSNYIAALTTEIRTFELDLVKEGWMVERINIGRTQPVASVKQSIRNSYMASPGLLKGLVILGHIPVPYSGSLNPDGHPDHSGAWPTDLYYCDTLSAYWTDVSINNIAASRPENHNIPGDGKFDQTQLPFTGTNLFCGRIDVFDMPAFSANDTLLMQRYLLKDHEYRTAQKTYRMRGLIDDNFGYFSGEAFGQNGFRNLASLLHPDSVQVGDYFPDMKANTYLWSYGCGGGWYQGAGGVGNTNNFQTDTIQSVFTMLFGSYFGDWDNQNNFLKAPLAGPGSALTNCWAGRPNYFFHHMGMGEPIGRSYLETIKNPNLYQPFGYGFKYIHQALMGDPSLKMYPYRGASNLVADSISGGSIATLIWLDSPDPQALGYHVYRSASLTDSFKLLNINYTTNNSYNDSTAPAGKNIYMVRAVKLQQTNTGTFYNLSPGIIDSTSILIPFAVNDRETDQLQINVYPNPATDFTLVESPAEIITGIKVNDISGRTVFSKQLNAHSLRIITEKWTPGIYEIHITTAKGDVTRRISVR